jgi:hypothetical protein
MDTTAALVRSGVVRVVRAMALLLARVQWYVPADSIEDALEIRKELVTVLADILTTRGAKCCQRGIVESEEIHCCVLHNRTSVDGIIRANETQKFT